MELVWYFAKLLLVAVAVCGGPTGRRRRSERYNEPKQTVVQVVPPNSGFNEKYVRVSWCLFPSRPVNSSITYSYIRVTDKAGGNKRKYYKIDNHVKCFISRDGPKDYEEMQKEYIREATKAQYKNGKRKKALRGCGPVSVYLWLQPCPGDRCVVNQWEEVTQCINRCKSTKEVPRDVRRSLLNAAGNVTFNIVDHTICQKERST